MYVVFYMYSYCKISGKKAIDCIYLNKMSDFYKI